MGQSIRQQDWPERLDEFLAKPHVFDWVNCNCALFAADAVLEMTGHDFAKEFRSIKTKRGMLAKLKRTYGNKVTDCAVSELGLPISLRMAKRGDVIAVKIKESSALGICLGSYSVFVSEDDGIVRIPTMECMVAWSI